VTTKARTSPRYSCKKTM